MQTFEEIQQQIIDLQKQADTMRKQAVAAAIKEIKRLVHLYQISYADLGISAPSSGKKSEPGSVKLKGNKSKPAKAAKKSGGDKRSTVLPKYRDSETGKTWTGRGKPPTWLAEKLAAGATKEQFKI